MADILRWKTVKTRKPHLCWGCQKEYSVGTAMVHASYADGGTVFDCYWCETCQEYMHQHFEAGDECGEGEIYENDPEEWERIRAEQEGE